jgi:hypothetical protein
VVIVGRALDSVSERADSVLDLLIKKKVLVRELREDLKSHNWIKHMFLVDEGMRKRNQGKHKWYFCQTFKGIF